MLWLDFGDIKDLFIFLGLVMVKGRTGVMEQLGVKNEKPYQ